jgi:DHA1 family bicyclomycin/chloramphenicol resistance-like MFS transporter
MRHIVEHLTPDLFPHSTLFGSSGPPIFALALLPASLMGSCVRPSGAFLMLAQQKEDTGSASALINCFALMFGSFGMILVSTGGNNRIVTLGMINILVGLVCLWAWLGICKRNLMIEVPEIATVTR